MSETHAPQNLQRKLGARHLNMIAIGGSIGTGLFLASGSTIANAGPVVRYSPMPHWYHDLFLNDQFR
jgi:amino acid permease